MVSRRLKLKPNQAEVAQLEQVMFQLAGLYNWGAIKLFRDGLGGRFYSKYDFMALINGHGRKCGLNQQTMNEVLKRVMLAHKARVIRSRPARLKSVRNRMNYIPLRSDIRWTDRTHLKLPGFDPIKVRPGTDFPEGRIKYGIIQRKARGWYVTLVVDADPKPVPIVSGGAVGIDFGFATLATLSTGEKIERPGEYRRVERRLGQAQRGKGKRLAARLQQRAAEARRIRNHAISRDLVSRFDTIYASRDNYRGMARTNFGKSVADAGIYQLLTMLHAKSRAGGRRVVEVSNHNSTRACSDCGSPSGPHGRTGLKVRVWTCGACGAHHDRDINAAVNTLRLGAALAHERPRERASEISDSTLVRCH